MKQGFIRILQRYIGEEKATAFVEAAIFIPIMLTLLMGVFDIGNGIIINQKTITSSQIAADLVGRVKSVDQSDVNNIVEAARLAYQPHGTSDFGIDIVSIEFDENGDPLILWRETINMQPNQNAVDSTAGLSPEGEGIIIVSVNYDYQPLFTQLFVDNFEMQEVAFSRGRRSRTVTWQD